MPDLPVAAPGKKTRYRVHLDVFEGPLDLLLQLIEREELDVSRVSLARVADQYLAYLATLERLQVDDLSDFIVVAARLLLIKSQSLLPRPPIAVQLEEKDPAGELIRQLRVYKQYKEAAQRLADRKEQGYRNFVRLVPQVSLETGIEHLESVSLDTFMAVARRAMQNRAKPQDVGDVASPFTITIDDQIELITRSLILTTRMSFTDLLTASYTRNEVAVTLLALLELIKRQDVIIRQVRMFGEIVILPLTKDG
jgi:segregation and condensation protein A